MTTRSKLSALDPNGMPGKDEILRRKRAIREKYAMRGALNRRGKFLGALKVVLYTLGGPLVWIFSPASKKR